MLQEAKESAHNQTFPVNVLVIVDENQRGPAWARNQGIKQANTRYIAFLDADDLWVEDKIERQLTQMSEMDAGLCVEGTPRSNKRFVYEIFIGKLGSLTSSALIDTEKITATFEESLARREDHLFLIEAAIQGGVCFCPNLIKVRKHNEGLSATSTVQLHYEENIHFKELACERAPQTREYLDEFYAALYYGQGRREHFNKKYARAIKLFRKSLSFKLRAKTAGGLLLSIIKLTFENRF